METKRGVSVLSSIEEALVHFVVYYFDGVGCAGKQAI